MDAEGLAEAWDAVEAVTAPPSIPAGFGVLVVTVGSSTCRSTTDVLGVEVDDGRAVVVLDADGEFAQPCPGPPGRRGAPCTPWPCPPMSRAR